MFGTFETKVGHFAFDHSFDFQEQLNHLGGPRLLVLFSDEGQFSSMMFITQTVPTLVILEVGGPVVMDSRASKVRQNVYVVHRSLTSFGVKTIIGQVFSTGHMQPMTFTRHPQPSFIKMSHLSFYQGRFDHFDGWVNRLSHLDIVL